MVSNVHEVLIAIPPDGGYAWIIVVASFFSNFAMDGIVYSFAKEMNEISAKLNIPLTKVSVIGSIQLGLYYMIGPITSAIVNRFGFRKVALSGCIISFVGIFSASYATSYIAIVFLYGCLGDNGLFVDQFSFSQPPSNHTGGIGFGMIYAPSVIIIGYYFEKYRALSTGIAISGSSVGTLCLSPLFAYIVDKYSWETTMKIQSAFISICVISALAYRQLEPTRVPITAEEIDVLSTATSHTEFIQLYDTNALETIDLNNTSEESRHFPKISIISSRFVPISQMADKNKKERCGKCLQCLCCKSSTKKTKDEVNVTNKVISTGPLDRKDIFYNASLLLLPEYKMDKDNQRKYQNMEPSLPSLSYHISMIHDPRDLRSLIYDPIASVESSDNKTPSKTQHNFFISNMIKKAFLILFDMSLLKSPIFLMICGGSFFYAFGWFVPYMFVSKRAESNKIPEEYSIWLVGYISVGNGVGRLISGIVSSLIPKINTSYMVGCFTIFAGIITIISTVVLTDNAIFQIIYCVLMGFSIAFLNTLRSVTVVKLLGLDKLTNAFGLSAVVVGIGNSIGVPIASLLLDATQSYLSVFLMTGISYIFAGSFMILAFHVYSWQQQKKN